MLSFVILWALYKFLGFVSNLCFRVSNIYNLLPLLIMTEIPYPAYFCSKMLEIRVPLKLNKWVVPPFLTFFDLCEIELITVVLSRQVVHALCFDQLYCCTCKLFISLCTLVQDNLAPALPQYDVNTC